MCRSRGSRWLLRGLALRIALCVSPTLALQLCPSSAHAFEEVWHTRFRASPGGEEEGLLAATDAAGNVYIAGTAEQLESDYDSDNHIIKYSVTGEVIWEAGSETLNPQPPVALLVDSKGVAYLLSASEDDDRDKMTRLEKCLSDGGRIWIDTFPGDDEGSSDDDDWTADPHALVLAPDGGKYVLCTLSKSIGEFSTAIIRYGPDDKMSWLAERAGESGSVMALASGGDIIAAGGTSTGVFVVVYGSDGTERSFATASIGAPVTVEKLAVAPDGFLHLAGSSEGLAVLVKLDPRGELLWSTTVAGGDTVHIARVALSEDSDVLVAGSAGPSDELIGFVTKQDPSGKLLWRTSFGGADPAAVKDMSIAPDGSLRLTGSAGAISNRDYWTAALDSSGAVLWERRYDGGGEDTANALTIDRTGNVHVTGASFGRNSRDMVTVTYSSSGTELRAARFEHPQGAAVHQVAADSHGNAIVAGACGRTGNVLKYDASGGLIWGYEFPRSVEGSDEYSVAVDGEGNVLVSDDSLVKLDESGGILWVKEGRAFRRHIAPDVDGNVYVTGGEPWSVRRWEPTLAKLDADGSEAWQRTPDQFPLRGLVLDPEGQPIVFVKGSDFSSTVFKYDPDGELLWSAPAPAEFQITQIRADAFGNVYLLGNGVVKLDPLGGFLWRVAEPQQPVWDTWDDIVLDSSGFAYTWHFTRPGRVLMKLAPDGTEAWRTDELDWILRLFLDASGTLFPLGKLYPAPRTVYSVGELDPVGDLVAQFTFGPTDCCLSSAAVASTRDGELIIAAGSEGEYSAFRFRPSGRKRFLRGDVNRDGAILMDDAIVGLEWLFRGGPEPACPDAADSNDDGRNDITDPIYILNHLFTGGPAPLPPFPAEGPDPTTDGLGCSV